MSMGEWLQVVNIRLRTTANLWGLMDHPRDRPGTSWWYLKVLRRLRK